MTWQEACSGAQPGLKGTRPAENHDAKVELPLCATAPRQRLELVRCSEQQYLDACGVDFLRMAEGR